MAEVAEKKLDRAVRAGQVRRVHGTDWVGDAAKLGVISEDEARLLREVEELTARVIAVDLVFTAIFYFTAPVK